MQCDADDDPTSAYLTPRRSQSTVARLPDHYSPVTDSASPEQMAMIKRANPGVHNQQRGSGGSGNDCVNINASSSWYAVVVVAVVVVVPAASAASWQVAAWFSPS